MEGARYAVLAFVLAAAGCGVVTGIDEYVVDVEHPDDAGVIEAGGPAGPIAEGGAAPGVDAGDDAADAAGDATTDADAATPIDGGSLPFPPSCELKTCDNTPGQTDCHLDTCDGPGWATDQNGPGGVKRLNGTCTFEAKAGSSRAAIETTAPSPAPFEFELRFTVSPGKDLPKAVLASITASWVVEVRYSAQAVQLCEVASGSCTPAIAIPAADAAIDVYGLVTSTESTVWLMAGASTSCTVAGSLSFDKAGGASLKAEVGCLTGSCTVDGDDARLTIHRL